MTKEQLEDDDEHTPVVSGSPAAIWLVYVDIDVDCTHDECDEVTWCDTDMGPSDVRYVRGDRFDELKAEVDRLTAENERLREAGVGYSQQTVDAITKEREALRAEVDRLTALLRRAYDAGDPAYEFGTTLCREIIVALDDQKELAWFDDRYRKQKP